MVNPRGSRTSELKRPFRVAARSASPSRTAARRSGGPSSSHDEFDTAACVGLTAISMRVTAPALHGLLGRLTEDLVERDSGVLPDLVGGLHVEVDLDVVARRDPTSERAGSGGETELLEDAWLEVVAELTEITSGVARKLETARQDLSRTVGCRRRRGRPGQRRSSARSRTSC